MGTVAPAARVGTYVSALQFFSIGVGPSSSHTVGPMRAGLSFARRAVALSGVSRVSVTLYGSLAATGLGHGTPDAIVAGLTNREPETCDPADVRGAWSSLGDCSTLLLAGTAPIVFRKNDIAFDHITRELPHPNTMKFVAWVGDARALEETYLSVGGGFIEQGGAAAPGTAQAVPNELAYASAAELLSLCADGRSIADIAWRTECAWREPATVTAGLDAIWAAMRQCVTAGLSTEGVLPGGLGVPRRAPVMKRWLQERPDATAGDWLSVFALAVNEENAAGGRVVTAPTNGAAGIVPAVLHYWFERNPAASAESVREFLLTAAAIGSLLKANASISGAEGGCQAEVGSACAMAAAGLCAVLGGTPAQVENAAEIAVEHHLGLTCDPVAGLVQIPCIERNAVAASTAVTAARLALAGDGQHIVSLDAVIETMRQTGADMSDNYKETSRGGLAVNVVEC